MAKKSSKAKSTKKSSVKKIAAKKTSFPKIKSEGDFKKFVESVQSAQGYRKPIGFGICHVTSGAKDPQKILTCQFPVVNWNENFGSAAIFLAASGVTPQGAEMVLPIDKSFIEKAYALFAPYHKAAIGDQHRNVQAIQTLRSICGKNPKLCQDYRLVFLFEDTEPQSVPAIYLKLLAMSHGKAKPRTLNLTSIFGKLENLAWIGEQPVELSELRDMEIELKLLGQFPAIDYVDKFPRYLMHVVPSDNTRILDCTRVRLGAHLAGGTTIMPGASYINFNAGTLGPSMVEGRISSSATIGAGTDVGGGASIMGVLSGGNSTPIAIGEKCLLGANSVTGVPLGDGCIIDAGIAILAGTKIAIASAEMQKLSDVNPSKNLKALAESYDAQSGFYILKAGTLAGCNGLHFRQDSQNGRMIAQRSKKEIELNKDLHGKPAAA